MAAMASVTLSPRTRVSGGSGADVSASASAPKDVASIAFTLNGKSVTVDSPSPTMTLNEYLRTCANLKGTKRSCGEGGCGACVVMMSRFDSGLQQAVHVPVNSCLRLLCSVDGWAITTIEGVGGRHTSYNGIQKTLAAYNGTQCGFCSSGFVMNMYTLLSANPSPSLQQVEDLFDGNLCRCTGYRPILDAMKTFAIDSLVAPDIEEIARIRATVPCCSLPCGRDCSAPSAQSRLRIVQDGVQWIRPNTLSELYATVVAQTQPFRLVCGNTGSGVFKKDADGTMVFIDVSVLNDLRSVSQQAQRMLFGSSITLAELITSLTQNASLSPSYSALAMHLKRIANVAVRSAGSWAGNLMLAHAHADFPSDVFTIMAGAGAVVQVCNGGAVKELDLFSFLQTDMTKQVVIGLGVPFSSAGEVLVTYKIMPRHTNAHAYVNAAIRIKLDANRNVVGVPTIVYGGISAFACQAVRTAQYLSGKSLSDVATLHGAMTMLQSELQPDSPPVAASADYRVFLACALLYKTIVALVPSADPRVQTAGKTFVRPVSSGQQSFDTDPSEYPVSQPVGKLEGLAQTSGEARYLDDRPIQPGTLFAAFFVATQANATLSAIDVSAVLKAPGVVQVITAADLAPGTNNFMPSMIGAAEVLFVPLGAVVDYAGQGVGIVLADTQMHANAAAELAVLSFTNINKPILTISDAVAAKSFFPCPLSPVQSGEDITKALGESPHVVSGSVTCGGQYHMHMETQSSEAVPTDDGGIDLYSSTQWLDLTQRSAAQMSGLPAGRIRVTIPRIGGAYGGKITRSLMVSSAVSVAAVRTNLPVRCVLPLSTNMQMIGKRNPFTCNYSVGFDDRGLLHAVKLDYLADCGFSPSDTVGTMSMALTICDNAYACPNWLVTPYLLKTNLPTNTACRAPGVCPAVFFMETVMENVAKTLGVAPELVRQANLYQKGQVTPYGQPLPYCSLSSLWAQAMTSMDFASRKSLVSAFNTANRWRKRGISIAPQKYGLVWNTENLSAYIAIYGHDGSVVVTHAGIESGQGINTKVAQVVAYKLGVPLEKVTVELPKVFDAPNTACTGGSVTSELCCMAAEAACDILNQRLEPVRKSLPPTATWQDLINKCVQQLVELGARGWVTPTHTAPFQYNSYGVVCTEVEIDVLTGEQQILRADILFDCGQSLNPAVDLGQVEGGFVMGLGYFTTELLKYDALTGRNLTDGTWEYKPPAVKDIPIDLRVTLLPNAPNPAGYLRSKACGEPPLTMASNIIMALGQAVQAAIAELPGPVPVLLDAPATVENIQLQCKVSPAMFFL